MNTKKFKIKNSTFIITSILTVVCIIFCFICSYFLNIEVSSSTNQPTISLTGVKMIKDILVVVTTILGTNLLLSLLIEVRSKNCLVEEIILNDVISSPKFYDNMDREIQAKMCNALEKKIYFNNDKTQEMFADIRLKLNKEIEGYYYESCNYVITCTVHDSYIEKDISKTVSIKSYDSEYTIKKFCISNFSSKKINGMQPFDLTKFEINNQEIDLEKDVILEPDKLYNLDKQNGYDINNRYIYLHPLSVNNATETKVTVTCTARTTIDDTYSTFRVRKPCKNFSLTYTLNQHEKYRLAVAAFGFLDDANESTNNNSKSNVNIKFNNWIYKNDGVVVIILNK